MMDEAVADRVDVKFKLNQWRYVDGKRCFKTGTEEALADGLLAEHLKLFIMRLGLDCPVEVQPTTRRCESVTVTLQGTEEAGREFIVGAVEAAYWVIRQLVVRIFAEHGPLPGPLGEVVPRVKEIKQKADQISRITDNQKGWRAGDKDA